jgi:hypothetical protein
MLLAIALLGVGCQTPQVAEPLTESTAGNDMDSQLEFWHVLTERQLTSHDEAFHGLLLFIDGEDPANDYAGRVELLQQRGLLPQSFDGEVHEAITRGTLAVALCNALDIKGGVVMRMIGNRPRYAVRELEYLNIYPPSSEQQTIRGNEFVFVIGRAEDYLRQVNQKASPQKINPEEGAAS